MPPVVVEQKVSEPAQQKEQQVSVQTQGQQQQKKVVQKIEKPVGQAKKGVIKKGRATRAR